MSNSERPVDSNITTFGDAFVAALPSDLPSRSQVPMQDLRKKTPLVLIILGIAGIMWLLAAVPLLSDAGDGGFALVILAGSGFLLGFIWFTSVRFYAQVLHPWFWQAKAWVAIVPLVGVIGFVLAYTDADLALRVWLCEPSLRRYAVNTVPHYSPTGEWVGLFYVDELAASSGAFALYTDTEGLLNRAGIAYVPPGNQPPPGVRIKRRLYGNWYSFWWRFP
jgi:hypothetical protein